MTKFFIDVSQEIYKKLEQPIVEIIVLEFIKYKESSERYEHPAPTIKSQQKKESPYIEFGRDRYDIAHKSEDVQHIHLRDGTKSWEDEQGPLVQWNCTSDTHLIYSYFKHNGAYYYYLVEIYDDKAHLSYEKAKLELFKEAKRYKETKLNELRNPKTA
ncbi:MAG: type II toxin-antitoxin system YafO family toxin [Niameybacter sp.]